MKITLHPLKSNGSIDESVSLYPKTLFSQLLDDENAPIMKGAKDGYFLTTQNGLVKWVAVQGGTGKANLEGGNTFTGAQTLNDSNYNYTAQIKDGVFGIGSSWETSFKLDKDGNAEFYSRPKINGGDTVALTSDLSSYATESWVAGQNYATKQYVLNGMNETADWVNKQSFATQTWVTDKEYATESWVEGKNYASLVDGKIPSSQLPSYVDDVVEYDSKSGFPSTGESGKIYVDKKANLTYRWSGTAYVEISPSLALGETSSTAYPGDKGKANADAIAGFSDAAKKGVDTSISDASTSTNLPTSQAVASFVEGKGYTKNEGTVTSVAIKINGVVVGTITSSGTIDLGTIATSDNNTTYSLTQDSADGHKITLTPSVGAAQTITIPDNNTTYSSKSAAKDGTDVSLVTTGEKYTWDNKADTDDIPDISGKVDKSGDTMTGALEVKATLTCDNLYSRGTVTAASDRNLKENLERCETVDLSSLCAYKYDFILDKDKTPHIGLIAQDVQKIYPEAIKVEKLKEKDALGLDERLSLDYNAIVALLVSKVNELEKRIKELEDAVL